MKNDIQDHPCSTWQDFRERKKRSSKDLTPPLVKTMSRTTSVIVICMLFRIYVKILIKNNMLLKRKIDLPRNLHSKMENPVYIYTYYPFLVVFFSDKRKNSLENSTSFNLKIPFAPNSPFKITLKAQFLLSHRM
jgi:hypothetical protein